MSTRSVSEPRQARPRAPNWPFFMAWVIIALNVAVLDVSEDLLAGLGSRSWTTLEGTVIDARVWQLGPHAFLPAVTYEFVTDYGFWRSGRFGAVGLSPPEFRELAAAEQWLHDRAYVAGAPIAVYAHPSRPDLSVLAPGLRMIVWVVFGALVLSVLLLDVWLILALRRAIRVARSQKSDTAMTPGAEAARPPRKNKRRRSRRSDPERVSPLLMALTWSFPVVMVVALNVGAVLSYREVVNEWYPERWLQAEGQITAIQYERRNEQDGDRRITRTYPKLHYAYTVDGREFSSSRYGLRAGIDLPGFRDPKALERFMVDHDYRVGRPLIVHYRADAPDHSVVNPARRLPILLLMALGAVAILVINWVALTFLVGLLRRRFTAAIE